MAYKKKGYNPKSGFQKGNSHNVGRKHTDQAKKNMSKGQEGNTKALGFKHSEAVRKRCSEFFKNNPNSGMFQPGYKKPQEVREKASQSLKERYKDKTKTSNWQGGKSFEKYSLLFDQQMKDRVRTRDNFVCQLCGVPELEGRRRLDVHHIDYDKKNSCIDNLISLCQKCHLKTNYDRARWKELFIKRTYQPQERKAY